jgi:hypothetical protein
LSTVDHASSPLGRHLGLHPPVRTSLRPLLGFPVTARAVHLLADIEKSLLTDS